MSVNLEWDAAHELISPLGSVVFNDLGPILEDGVTYAYYKLNSSPYQIVPAIRATVDNLSQADGSSLQPPYITGLVASLHVEYWTCVNGNLDDKAPACGTQVREMDDLLTLNLNALRNQGPTPDGTQRLLWQPTGTAGRRMLTQILMSQWMAPVFFGDDGIGVGVTFAVATPFPYAVDEDFVDVDIADGDTETIPNAGTASYSSVVNVAGSTAEFAITRMDTGDVVSYVGPDTIPGGQHAEIDFFTANIAEEGNDLIADLDPNVTVFFLVPPGGCPVKIEGADCTFVTRAAYL